MARQSRQAQARATETRKASHRPELQSVFESTLHIPEHIIPDGMTYAWVRAAWLNQPDNTNVSNKIRAGWKPVPRDRHIDQFPIIDIPGVAQSNVSVIAEGGLILCEMPTRDFKRRRAELDAKNRDVMEGIAWQQQGLGGAPTFDNSSKVQIERRITERAEFQDE